jgi:diguanylate cyclase (GGDEF)-like protein/PAS domain S-box-containing protein
VFWINVFYLYTLVLIGTILLVRKYVRSTGLYRRQTALVLVASSIPWVNNILFLCGLSPLPNIDNTPFAFSIVALFITFAILRYHLLDLVPIARDVLVENMSDGVIVIDNQNRIIDINPAAQHLIPISNESTIGKLFDHVFFAYSDVVSNFHGMNQVNTEIAIGDSPRLYFDLRISPLMDRRDRLVGRLIVFRDITELKHAQAELERMAMTDLLTEISNRRHFLELADKEVKRALRFNHPLTLVMMDLDDFKRINDNFGHDVGDQALIAFVQVCQKNIREIDILARIGGEEFVLLIPETRSDQAFQIAERVRLAVAESSYNFGVNQLIFTVSLGIANLDGEFDTLNELLHRADSALYAAKQSGRNRVMVWNASLAR